MVKIFQLLRDFIPGLFAYFLSIFGRKFAVGTASVLAFITVLIVFVASINTIIGYVSSLIVIPVVISRFISWIVPTNFVQVTSAMLSAKVCKSAFMVVLDKIKIMNSAS